MGIYRFWAYKDANGTVTFDSTSYWIFGGTDYADNTTTTYNSVVHIHFVQ